MHGKTRDNCGRPEPPKTSGADRFPDTDKFPVPRFSDDEDGSFLADQQGLVCGNTSGPDPLGLSLGN